MKHIGILGHSADGAALCFLEVIREAARNLGPHEHPEITLSMQAMSPTLAWYDTGEYDRVNRYLAATCERLAAAGCDFFVCPDNTAHLALDVATTALSLPGLHIAEVVADRAVELGFHRVGLLGTKWTMVGPAYDRAFGRVGIELCIPHANDRVYVNDVIFEELCQGILREDSRESFNMIIRRLKEEGCDAVALACTEIPLLVAPESSPLPTLDSTRLLAYAAVEVALGKRPLPIWRGG